jgi:hypothetical protein
MEMLHPSDASLIGIYCKSTQTEMSVVCDGKPEMYCTLFESFHSRYRIRAISKMYKNRKTGFFLEWEQLIYGFGKTKLARFHPNFNYMVTFEMTLKGWDGRKHSTVSS